MAVKNLSAKAVARDFVIILMLNIIATGLYTIVMWGKEGTREYVLAAAFSLVVLQTIGFTMVAYLSHENRWKQVFTVVVLWGIVGVANLLFFHHGYGSSEWFRPFVISVLAAVLGGALSYTFKRQERPLHLPMRETPPFDDTRMQILVSCGSAVLVAAFWPFIEPVLSWALAFLQVAKSPVDALIELGLLSGAFYGESENAPKFFKQMAETAQQFSGEHPQLASLPYMAKVRLSFYVSIFHYILAVLVFVFVTLVSLSSRMLPWKLARNFVQRIAIGLALLPVAAESLWCIYFLFLAFVQAWHAGVFYFVFLVLIYPVVAVKVISPNIGILFFAYFFVPVGLAFAGRGSLARFFLLRLLLHKHG